MSIQIQPKSSDELAAALREPTASPDDLLRIERGLARKLRERSAGSPARRLVPVGLLLATLAAAVLSWWARPLDGPAPVPVATLDAARVGQVIEGPEPTEAQLGNARLAVGAGSSIHVDAIDIAGASVTLTRGEVHVAFHPQHRGEEHLAVLTAAARVDVVGTEFTVSLSADGGTRVEVTEGIVRVTPSSGGEATLVEAGSSFEVPIALAVHVEPDLQVEDLVDPSASERPVAPRIETSARPVPTVELNREERIEALEAEADARHSAGDLRAEVEAQSQIISIDPHGERGAIALYMRARLREQLGDADSARADYQRYLTENPAGTHAAQARERLENVASAP